MSIQAECKLSSERLTLSEPLEAVISIEGPAPLVVQPPAALLGPTSEAFWQVAVLGKPTITQLPHGRERWEQRYRLEPFALGDQVPIQFADFTAATGLEPLRPVPIPLAEVAITSAAQAESPVRPVTGLESLPHASVASTGDLWLLIPVLFACAGLALWRLWRRQPRISVPQPVVTDPLSTLAGISDARTFAAELARTMRQEFERLTGSMYTCRTTGEIRLCNPDLADILQGCDAVTYAGAGLSADERASLLAKSRQAISRCQKSTAS